MSDKLSKIGSLVLVLLVLSSLIVVSYQFYSDVKTKANALRGSVNMLSDAIKNLVDPDGYRVSWIYGGQDYTLQLNGFILNAKNIHDVNVSKIEDSVRHIQGCTIQCVSYSTQANRLASSLYSQQLALKDKGIEIRGTSFESLYAIVSELQNTTLQIEKTTNELIDSANAAKTGDVAEFDALRTKGIELIAYYYQAEAETNEAINTIPATDVNVLAPFVLITVVFSVFLLLPCILLLLFFLQKHENLVERKTRLLTKLNLKENSTTKRNYQFSEYLVSIVFLTLIDATLLYFFFYPNATSGLAQLISVGGGIRAFSEYLAVDATPITFGFIGAYFYIMQMLLRRYFSSDLTPRAYSYALVRVLTVFVISVILQVMSSSSNLALLSTAIIAFVIGIFPDAGLRWILKSANSIVKNFGAPEFIDKDPLTKIEGLNTWHEARLLEEKIDNVQNLSSASLEQLITNTNFYPKQLFNWVDQAVLYTYAGEIWMNCFRLIGIKSASGLIANVKDNDTISKQKIEELTKAINDVRSIIPKKDTENSESSNKAQSKPSQPQMTSEILTAIITCVREDRAMNALQKWRDTEETT